ncbi:hypothetical protein K431DRAFT_95926 [Polychaeton citri CBS 116435]|uniref:Ras guanyl-nucleotide exchange factor RasGEF n=1 Tax=Polychaeton citri CBS 116435 TaxID=1314669 RepID=A0A9P4UP72_9PEZI|nr:hypothetical protein K431DRAFT_95926 [Polychaeton citri CBS 116435]
MTAQLQPTHLRSLYRRFLRELPVRQPSILANPSPIQKHIRADFSTPPFANVDTAASGSASLQSQLSKPAARRVAEAEQHLQYLASQREYLSLMERYNPGMNMNEEEKIRLTARRVGMDLPVEYIKGDGESSGSGGQSQGQA